jgi:hypothetical protein
VIKQPVFITSCLLKRIGKNRQRLNVVFFIDRCANLSHCLRHPFRLDNDRSKRVAKDFSNDPAQIHGFDGWSITSLYYGNLLLRQFVSPGGPLMNIPQSRSNSS